VEKPPWEGLANRATALSSKNASRETVARARLGKRRKTSIWKCRVYIAGCGLARDMKSGCSMRAPRGRRVGEGEVTTFCCSSLFYATVALLGVASSVRKGMGDANGFEGAWAVWDKGERCGVLQMRDGLDYWRCVY
jgi:hypothetical protein